MYYLVYNDYAVTVQDAVFKQWISSNQSLRLQAESRAEAKIREYLVQKYDLDTEFAPTKVYSPATTYGGNSLVQLNATAWSAATASYALASYVSYTDGNVYKCILQTTIAHEVPTNATYWRLVGVQLGLYYIDYPYPLFQQQGFYNIGDKVFWKGKIYQSLVQTIVPDHQDEIQFQTYSSIPGLNVFPDDAVNGVLSWGVGVAYSVTGLDPNVTQPTWSGVTAYVQGDRVTYNDVTWECRIANTGKIPGDTITYWQSETWIFGDNRNQSIVDAYVAIVMYYLSPRISPKVLPQWVLDKYRMAMDWLQAGAEGLITLDLPEIQPAQGARLRFNSQPKQINGY